jgi:hypothetical protein
MENELLKLMERCSLSSIKDESLRILISLIGWDKFLSLAQKIGGKLIYIPKMIIPEMKQRIMGEFFREPDHSYKRFRLIFKLSRRSYFRYKKRYGGKNE